MVAAPATTRAAIRKGNTVNPSAAIQDCLDLHLGFVAGDSGEEVTPTMLHGLMISTLDHKTAAQLVVAEHYLHRRPPISHAFGVHRRGRLMGAVTYGTPASRHLQMSACPSEPGLVVELNRLWLDDALPENSESWFVSRTLRMLPPRIVVSYADPLFGHYGYIYRALNFRYAGWTDMDRKTPRYDYIPADPRTHTRDAFRNGYVQKRRRVAKVKYWTVTGNRADRRRLTALCGWPSLDWHVLPPPAPAATAEDVTA
jgi:hypothetical protein